MRWGWDVCTKESLIDWWRKYNSESFFSFLSRDSFFCSSSHHQLIISLSLYPSIHPLLDPFSMGYNLQLIASPSPSSSSSISCQSSSSPDKGNYKYLEASGTFNCLWIDKLPPFPPFYPLSLSLPISLQWMAIPWWIHFICKLCHVWWAQLGKADELTSEWRVTERRRGDRHREDVQVGQGGGWLNWIGWIY